MYPTGSVNKKTRLCSRPALRLLKKKIFHQAVTLGWRLCSGQLQQAETARSLSGSALNKSSLPLHYGGRILLVRLGFLAVRVPPTRLAGSQTTFFFSRSFEGPSLWLKKKKKKKKFNVSIPFLNGPHSPAAAAAARTFFPSDFKQSETNSSAALFFCGFPFLSACRTHAAFLQGSLFMATASF